MDPLLSSGTMTWASSQKKKPGKMPLIAATFFSLIGNAKAADLSTKEFVQQTTLFFSICTLLFLLIFHQEIYSKLCAPCSASKTQQSHEIIDL